MCSNVINTSPSFCGLSISQFHGGKTVTSQLQAKLLADNKVWKVAKAYAPNQGVTRLISESESNILLKVINTLTGQDIKVPSSQQKIISNIDGKHIIYGDVLPGKVLSPEENRFIFNIDLDA